MSFKVNNDLNRINADLHNLFHFFVSLIMATFLGFTITYLLWLLWEVGDGFKPWYNTFENRNNGNWIDFIRRELFYSNYFSLQDIFVWNLSGALLGSLLTIIL